MKLSRPVVSGIEILFRESLEKRCDPITRYAIHFTYSEQKHSIPVGAFSLILVKLKLSIGYDYSEILIDFVRKKEPLSILLFVSAGSRLSSMIKGNPMFNNFIPDIRNILSGSRLQFTPEVFLKIARTITPKFYNEVTMYEDRMPLNQEDDCIPELFNPFSLRPDFCGIPMKRSEKIHCRCVLRIEQPAVEVPVEVADEDRPMIYNCIYIL